MPGRKPRLHFDKKDWYFQKGVTSFSKQERRNLQMDKVGMFSTTHAKHAQEMSDLIAFLPGMSKEILGRAPTITDACSGCGGNTISFAFCGHFAHVTAVESNARRTKILTHNMSFANKVRSSQTNVRILCDSYLNVMTMIVQDVIFLDPPWGGVQYKKERKIILYLDKIHIARVVSEIFNNANVNQTKFIVLKVPLNFDISDMRKQLVDTENESETLTVDLLKKFKKFDLLCIRLSPTPESMHVHDKENNIQENLITHDDEDPQLGCMSYFRLLVCGCA